jgi:hypothetical protein
MACLFVSCCRISSSEAQYGEVVAPPVDLQVGFDTITAEQAEEWLHLLAGPQFEGRGTGQIGYMKAAHWVAGKLAEFGLQPIGDGETYFQMMPIVRRLPEIEECRILGPNGLVIEGAGQLGFERYTDQGEVRGKAVFLSFVGPNPTVPEDLELRETIVFYAADDLAAPAVPRLLARLRPSATLRLIGNPPVSAPQTLFPGRRSRSTSVSGTLLKSAGQGLAAGDPGRMGPTIVTARDGPGSHFADEAAGTTRRRAQRAGLAGGLRSRAQA